MEETFVLDQHPNGLGIRFKLVGRLCSLFYAVEYGHTVLNLEHDAVLSQDGLARKASCPRGAETCSFQCSVAGFSLHFSAALFQAILVPRTQQTGSCACGIGMIPVDASGTTVSAGTFGPEQEWGFTASGNSQYILTTINDDCAITFEV